MVIIFGGGGYFYLPGEKSYGRIESLPSMSVSSLKANCKNAILKYIANNTQSNFVELDIKSCHTVVARSFLQKQGVTLPEINEHWNTMIRQF